MFPAYILHHSSTKEREQLVKNLQEQTGAIVFDPVWLPENPPRGCRESHVKLANTMKEINPDSPYIVFEDDCEIIDPGFYSLLSDHPHVDLLYFGVTQYGTLNRYHNIPHCSFGTHAMYITPKARDIFLEHWNEIVQEGIPHIDQIWNVIEHNYSLSTWKPQPQDRHRWVRQKPGLPSVGRQYNTRH